MVYDMDEQILSSISNFRLSKLNNYSTGSSFTYNIAKKELEATKIKAKYDIKEL